MKVENIIYVNVKNSNEVYFYFFFFLFPLNCEPDMAFEEKRKKMTQQFIQFEILKRPVD